MRRHLSLSLLLLALVLPLAAAFPLGWFEAHTAQRDSERALRKKTPGDSEGGGGGAWDAWRLDAKLQRADDHAYFRPSGDEVSGRPKNDRKYHRAPCPCMNSLANHGYLPRDGKNLTPEMIKRAVVEVFNLDEGLAQTLVSSLPPTLTLADLGVHNFIEHDASMIHDDHFFGRDPAEINATLADALLQSAPAQRLTKREIAHFRHDREKQCARTNPEYDFGAKKQAAAYAEAASVLLAMGDYESESISVADARSFLVEERIPDGFQRPQHTITASKALYVAAKIKAMSMWPWTLVESMERALENLSAGVWVPGFPLSAAT
ncbi:hypothetical protein ATCC90586_004974 [Pythium insidiosum]|nr:hypothetical protein ATCC90586_004974 [Pythium insidiosum]